MWPRGRLVPGPAEHEIDEAVSGGDETTRSSRTAMNALAYVTPEVVDKPRTASKPSDVWAIAAITWEILTRAPPFGAGLRALKALFSSQTPPSLRPKIANHPQLGGLSRELAEIIASCFVREARRAPDCRPAVRTLRRICYLPPYGTQRHPTCVMNIVRKTAVLRSIFMARLVLLNGSLPLGNLRFS
jgi:serine/threonine protein kinase